MISKSIKTVVFFIVCIIFALPQIASAELPPRPIRPSTTAGNSEKVPDGAKLILIMPVSGSFKATEDSWTQIQWQDAFGHWHDVDGWAGSPTFNAQKGRFEVEWWVDKGHLSAGPFRWVVQNNQKASQAIYSEKFDLPAHPGEVKLIDL